MLKLGIGLYEDINSKGKKVTRTDIHTHMLRGTFATRRAEAKIVPTVIKEILGHSDISITMKYYFVIDIYLVIIFTYLVIAIKTAKYSNTLLRTSFIGISNQLLFATLILIKHHIYFKLITTISR